ncbi:MAG TPA: hypothetical protein VGJ20_42105 [Xanthobacteraceae bacterium]
MRSKLLRRMGTVRLEPWQGPFADPTQRLPQARDLAAQRRAAMQQWRERQRPQGRAVGDGA